MRLMKSCLLVGRQGRVGTLLRCCLLAGTPGSVDESSEELFAGWKVREVGGGF